MKEDWWELSIVLELLNRVMQLKSCRMNLNLGSEVRTAVSRPSHSASQASQNWLQYGSMFTKLTKRETVYATLLLSLFWILTMWGIWTREINALGWNLTVFTGALILLYTHSREPRRLTKREYVWLVPLLLVALSYSLYDNPFV